MSANDQAAKDAAKNTEQPSTEGPAETPSDEGTGTESTVPAVTPPKPPGQEELERRVRTEKTRVMDPVERGQMIRMANDLIASNAVPSCFESAEQVLMALMAGNEMGMNQMEALSSFYIVNGGLKIWGKAVPRRLRYHGWRFMVIEEDDTHCEIKVWKGSDGQEGYEKFEEDFKYADAVASGYTKDRYGKEKVGWLPGINRKKKMRYGALSVIIETYIPEVFGSIDGMVEMTQDYGDNAGDQKQRAAAAVESRRKKVIDQTPSAVDVTPGEEPSAE